MYDFAATRALFDLPDGVVYLDGNSLGPLPRAVPPRVAEMIRMEWGQQLIGGWNDAGWMDQPARLGDRIGRLIGAAPGSTVLGDTLSIKVFQALSAALALRPDRKVILSDTGNFPSDLYMADGLAALLDAGHKVRVVAPQDVLHALDDSVAVLMLTHVDYRTGRMHEMNALTAAAHAVGALTVWDLAHSAGAVPVDLTGCGADFAVGCTYKYLNSGPGGPAFIWMRPDLAMCSVPALSGWLGHAAPFAFERAYRPGDGIARMRVGTPPVIQMAALEAALEVWNAVSIQDIRERSVGLSEMFIQRVLASCPDLTLASPRAPAERGSQVSFQHHDGYAIMQALIARGVIGDFRAPDILRFGITPLYIGEDDIATAADTLADIMATRAWDQPDYKARKAVT